MKKKTNLMLDIKACLLFLFRKKKPITYVTCHYCKSPFVKFENGQENGNAYSSIYSCTKCGATCVNVETWEQAKR